MRRLLLRAFLRGYPVDLAEAAQPDPDAYPSFNDFFTRRLGTGARPLDAGGWRVAERHADGVRVARVVGNDLQRLCLLNTAAIINKVVKADAWPALLFDLMLGDTSRSYTGRHCAVV